MFYLILTLLTFLCVSCFTFYMFNLVLPFSFLPSYISYMYLPSSVFFLYMFTLFLYFPFPFFLQITFCFPHLDISFETEDILRFYIYYLLHPLHSFLIYTFPILYYIFTFLYSVSPKLNSCKMLPSHMSSNRKETVRTKHVEGHTA